MSDGQHAPEDGRPLRGEPSAGPASWPASERGAEPMTRTPPENPAETTAPLPPAPTSADPEYRTDGLPLLDLLAPEQVGPEQVAPEQVAPEQFGPEQFGPQPFEPEQIGHEHVGPEPIGRARHTRQPPVGPVAQGGSGLYGMPLLAPGGDPYGTAGGQPDYGEPSGHDPYAGTGGGFDPYAAGARDLYGVPPYRPIPPRSRRRPGARLVLAIGAAVLLLAVLGIWALTSTSGQPNQPVRAGRSSSPPAPTSTPIEAAGGYQFTQHAARTDTDCAANAYGQVAGFFRGTPCTKLDRRMYSTTVDGRLVVTSVSVVQMPTDQAATDLRKLADTNGTGNVSDLLRAGVRVPGGPDSLTDAGYASASDGATVVIAEADFADRAARDEGLLDRISKAALELRK